MGTQSFTVIITLIVGMGIFFYALFKLTRFAFFINVVLLISSFAILFYFETNSDFIFYLLTLFCPLLLINTVLYVFLHKANQTQGLNDKYQVHFKTKGSPFKINNIKRGVSVIGSAGSGKTESVVFNFLSHFSSHSFCGLIHDYKHFEITEICQKH